MWRASLLLLLPLNFFAIGAPAYAAEEPVTAEEVRSGIKRGIAYLKSKQNKVKGNWAEYPAQPGGMTALCTLALLEAGVDSRDETIVKALNYLRRLGKPKMVYSTALQTMAFVAADPSPRNPDKALIRRNAEYLASIQITGSDDKKGTWAYSDSQGNGDNSNTQFALLALHEAERVGVNIRSDVWRLSLRHWVGTQKEDGGWGYFKDQPTTGSMTCAGIASVVICSGMLSEGDASVKGGKVQCCGEGEADAATKALTDALDWMDRNISVESNPSTFSRDRPAFARLWLLYYMYGLERVGRLTGKRFFLPPRKERFDWYREGAASLIRKGQDKLTGAFTGVGHGEDNTLISTSFALLFLSKGLRPVLIAKLRREGGEDWNRHGSDIGNLARHVESLWGKNLTWQVIESRAATAEDLLFTPVLFISGRDQLVFTEKEKQNLKAYIDAGGFIFAENCCDGERFDRDFRALMKELFPDSQLRPLPADHPIWFAESKVLPNPEETPLEGLNSCCRTSVVYSPKDLGCYWELSRSRESMSYPAEVQKRIERAVAVGTNVLAYATGRELRDRIDIPQPVGADNNTQSVSRNTLYVAKLRHGGGSDDAPSALSNLLAVAREEVGLPASTERRLIAIGDEALFDYPIAFMHGRRAFRLTEVERNQLRQFLERGGFLLADAICANGDFARSFRREMAAIFRDQRLKQIPDTHPMFTPEFRGFDITRVTLRDPEFRAEGDPLKAKIYKVAPTLEAIELDNRYAVIFSPYDLSCALENSPSLECKGYDRRDAARIGVNLLLYGLQQ